MSVALTCRAYHSVKSIKSKNGKILHWYMSYSMCNIKVFSVHYWIYSVCCACLHRDLSQDVHNMQNSVCEEGMERNVKRFFHICWSNCESTPHSAITCTLQSRMFTYANALLPAQCEPGRACFIECQGNRLKNFKLQHEENVDFTFHTINRSKSDEIRCTLLWASAPCKGKLHSEINKCKI